MVYRAGAGPRCCRIQDLTVDRLVESMKVLMSGEVRIKVRELSGKMTAEDGISMGVHSFHNNLPLANMMCEVSVFERVPRLARIYCSHCNLKLSLPADSIVHRESSGRAHHKRILFRYKLSLIFFTIIQCIGLLVSE